MDSLEHDVRHLVSRQTGIEIERIGLTSTLGMDCGMDGDDAVELFESYEREFHVDISLLWLEWSTYFGSEVWPRWGFILVIIPLIPAATLMLIAEYWAGLRLPSWMEFPIFLISGMLLWGAWGVRSYWPLQHVFPALKPLRQITVADLVEAARRGRWDSGGT
jgi:hypothetical protein